MCEKHVQNNPARTMKHSKSDVRCKFTCLPQLRFVDQQLSSFSGLIVFQQLINDLDLKRRLSRCFEHQTGSPSFSTTSIVLILVVSMLLGYRRLRDVQFFKDDPVVLRLLGLHHMPTVSTISRQLSTVNDRSIGGIERLQQNLVIEALIREQLATITLDFDGSVLGTCRQAEGVANGFNKKKKGQRSYYPLYCTVAQTAQVLAVHHRSGNVHDSNGAKQFIEQCVEKIKNACPRAKIELRMDGHSSVSILLNAWMSWVWSTASASPSSVTPPRSSAISRSESGGADCARARSSLKNALRWIRGPLRPIGSCLFVIA